jgi:Mrp family chromosome partitioning ATPase
MSNVDDPPRMIQVTSSIPSEGKSTFAVSLATMLAKSGHNTALIDLDFHHPSVARELGVEAERCLVVYMVGDATLEDIVYVSDFGLTVLPIRRRAPDPSVLINSQRMRQLLSQLRGLSIPEQKGSKGWWKGGPWLGFGVGLGACARHMADTRQGALAAGQYR